MGRTCRKHGVRDIAMFGDCPKCLQEHGRVQQQVAWKTIETAPKDGTIVDLWMCGPRSPDGYREADCWYAHGQWWNSFGRDGDCAPGWMAGDIPTHWMPLPAPPAGV